MKEIGGKEEDKELLNQVTEQLNELFLLVVVGEFNSGKSSFLNALLSDDYLKTGITPTTDCLHCITYGSSEEKVQNIYDEKKNQINIKLPLKFFFFLIKILKDG
jgi:ribosome biogenesis GTPase A